MKMKHDHLEELVTDYRHQLLSLNQGVQASSHSPIETMLMVALIHVFRLEAFTMACGSDVPEDFPEGSTIHLIRQARIGRYRADFAILARFEERVDRFVVECDGFEFHERTKEQAQHDKSRDRFMADTGWRVYRFTGSEINRSPLLCAKQVLNSIYGASYA